MTLSKQQGQAAEVVWKKALMETLPPPARFCCGHETLLRAAEMDADALTWQKGPLFGSPRTWVTPVPQRDHASMRRKLSY